MKILLLNCVYKQGSTGKIIASLHEGLTERGYTSFVFYGTGIDVCEKNVRKICRPVEHYLNALLSRITGIPFGGIYVSNRKVRKFVLNEKPDVVHIHCINGSMINIYDLLSFLGKNGIKTVVTLHAEFFHTGSCSHAFDCKKWIDGCYSCNTYKDFLPSYFFDKSKEAWSKMETAFSSFKKGDIVITSVSPWLMNRAKQSKFLGRFENVYVPNGVDTKVFKTQPVTKKMRPVVLFVTPHFTPNNPLDQKGGKYLIEIARLCKNYVFKIVASKSSFSSGQLPPNVSFHGKASSQDQLCTLYNEADVTLVLSKRETFSMVTAESLCCGTPVVGFKAGGPESIAISKYSKFVDYGNINEIIKALRKVIENNYDSREIETVATDKYSFNTVTQLYINEYKKLKNE